MRYKIKVIPRASKNEVKVLGPQELKVKLTAPPVEGKANEALLEILADYFKIKKSQLRIVGGLASKNKTIEF